MHGPITDPGLKVQLALVSELGQEAISLDPDMPPNEWFRVEDEDDD